MRFHRYFRLSPCPLLMVSLAFLSACSSGPGDTALVDGMIAKIDGQVRKLSTAEEKTVCSNQFCEPNYIYSVNFGGSRPTPAPEPTPVPIYTPKPSPTPVTPPPFSVGPGDQVDYAKAILGLPEAWKITQGSREVIVAVVDTGVNVDHPDLRQNMWVNVAELGGKPGVDNDGNGLIGDVFGWDFFHNQPNAVDDNKHGSHVAGIIGAVMNGSGTVGVSPKVRIMPVKFLGPGGQGDAVAAISAINYAVNMGAHIISNSWGGGGYSSLMNDAIQRAIQKGIIVVAAAGNNAQNNDAYVTFPAGYDNVVGVASSDENDELSYFSNYGNRTVAFAAPGSHIYSTVLGNGYDYLSGTSMATPQVSGALALAMSVNHGLSPIALLDQMCATSRKILLDKVACGRIDVEAFVKSVH